MSRADQKTVLLTLGRLPVALDLARGFRQAGWRVIVAESHRLQLCGMSRAVDAVARVPSARDDRPGYLEALRKAIREYDVDLVVPVSEETVTVAALADEGEVSVFCPASGKVLQLHDKLAFNQLARNHGMPAPLSWNSLDALPEAYENGPLILKPRFSASGRGLRIVERPEDIEGSPGILVQEYLQGDEISGFAIATNGRIRASAVYRSRVKSGSVAVCFERLENAAGVEKWMSDFVAKVDHSGFIAFDFILDADGVPMAIECNPRATSGLHFLRTEDFPTIIEGSDAATALPRFRDSLCLAESYSCFTTLLGVLGNGEQRRAAWSGMRAASDICWDRSDPMPFLLMTVNSWPIIWASIRNSCSFAEAAVHDIEWRDDAV